MAARLANAAFVVVAVRRLGAVEYGLYATALTVLLFARLLSRLGLQGIIVVRDVAEQRDRAVRYLSSAIMLALPPSLLLWLVLPPVSRALGYPEPLGALLGILGLALLGHAVARPADDVLRAFEEMPRLGAASLALSLGTAAAGLLLLGLGFGVPALMALQVAAAWGEALLLLGLVHRRAVPLAWRPSVEVMSGLAREGLVLFGLLAFDFVLTRIDVLVLARLRGPEAVGLYAPALRVVEYAAILRAGAGGALFPFLAARRREATATMGSTYQEALRFYALYGVGTAVALSFGAEAIVGLLFGSARMEGARVLPILAWAMALDLAAGPYAEVILARREPLARFVPAMGGLALLNLALNLWLVPDLGPQGAALAALVTMATAFGVRTRWVRDVLRDTPPSPWGPLLRASVAGLAMSLVFALLRSRGFWLALPPAALAYLGGLLVTGALRRDEVRQLGRALVGLARHPWR